MSLKTVSIVGTAGRKGGWKKMSKELYMMMYDKAKVVITQYFGLELPHVHLVSGGAAWAGKVYSMASQQGILVTSRILIKLGVFVVLIVLTTHSNFWPHTMRCVSNL